MSSKTKKILKIAIPVAVVLVIVIALVLTSGNVYPNEHSTINTTVESAMATGSDASPATGSADAGKSISGHTLVAENDNYELYLYKPSLSIIVKDKKTGAIMESTVLEDDGKSNASWKGFIQSGVVVEMQESNTSQQKKIDLVNSGAEIAVENIEGGFKAKIDYTKYEYGFEVTVRLFDDGSLEVTLPESSIYENSEVYKIGNIYLYPFLGYTTLGETEGYMLIPDGNGALINLDNKEGKFRAGFSKRVYGDDIGVGDSYVLSLFWDEYETINDSEYVLAPYWGMVHSESEMAYLGVIECGAEGATIEAYPNGVYTNYNWVTAKFTKHRTYVVPTSRNGGGSVTKVTERIPYDIRVRYMFTGGDEADYAGLANVYRDYLITNGVISAKNTAFRLRMDFLASDREEWMFTTKAVTVTTADNIREMYEDMEASGVTSIYSAVKGWQDGGINNLPVTKLDTESSFGSNSDVKKLVKEAEEKGIILSLYNDGLRANPDTVNTTFNVVKKLDKRLYEEDTFMDVYQTMVFVTPAKAAANLADLTASLSKSGVNSLTLAGITNNIFSYTYEDEIFTRFDSEGAYIEAIQAADEKLSLMLEEPFMVYWKYMDAFLDMPVADSDYIFSDESIPFLSIVLKGSVPMYSDYVNFEANKQEFFLKLVETGIYPSFYITYEDSSELIYTNSCDVYSSKYTVYKDTMVEYYNELKTIDELTGGAFISDHEIKDDVAVVTYTNGVKIYVNYASTDVTVDGITVPAMSYKVGGAE